ILAQAVGGLLARFAPSTIPISSSVSPYSSYTSRSICRSVASIWSWSAVLPFLRPGGRSTFSAAVPRDDAKDSLLSNLLPLDQVFSYIFYGLPNQLGV